VCVIVLKVYTAFRTGDDSADSHWLLFYKSLLAVLLGLFLDDRIADAKAFDVVRVESVKLLLLGYLLVSILINTQMPSHLSRTLTDNWYVLDGVPFSLVSGKFDV
jgi:hypothetical protein